MRRVPFNLWGLLFAPGLFLVCTLLPQSLIEGLPLCFIKQISGFFCPGCGLTRAFSFLFKGDFHHALLMNALCPVLVLWFSLYSLENLYRWRYGQKPQWFTPQGNRMISRLFIVLFVGQWIASNFL